MTIAADTVAPSISYEGLLFTVPSMKMKSSCFKETYTIQD